MQFIQKQPNPEPKAQAPAEASSALVPSQGDPFEGLGGVAATEIKSEEHLKIAIIGKPKTGKSWMAVTAPKPIMVYDFDDRAQSLRGKEGIRVLTLKDVKQDAPTAVMTLEQQLSALKYAKSQGKPVPETIVLDSMTYLKKYLENELMRQAGSKFYRVIKTSPTSSIRIPQGWDVVNGVRGYMEYLIAEFSTIANVICVFHEKDEKDRSESTATETKYTGQLTIDPQYLESLLSFFNEVFFLKVDSMGKYTVTTKPTYECRASTTLLIDQTEIPDISAMIEKHRQRLATSK